MAELQWAPAALFALTPTQLICLCYEKPPGSERPTVDSADGYAAMVERRRREAEREEAEWRDRPSPRRSY